MVTRDGVNFETVSARLRKDIAYHKKYQDQDFMKSELTKWCSIVLSGASAILIAIFGGKDYAQVLAVPAALSTVVVLIDQRIPYRARSGWHFNVKIGLEELLLRLEKEDADVVEQARIALEKRLANEFPGDAKAVA